MPRPRQSLFFAFLFILLSNLTPANAYAQGKYLPDSPEACMGSDGYYDCDLCTCPLISWYLIVILIVYSLCLIISLIPIVGFLVSSKLREQPGDFFFVLSVAGAIGSFTMLFEGIYDAYTNLGQDGLENFCLGFAVSSDFTKRLSRFYNIAFMIYFMISLRFTLKQSKVPRLLYHVVPWLVSAAWSIKLAVGGALGKVIDGTCGTKSSAESAGYITETVICCLMILVFLYMWKYLSGQSSRLEIDAQKQLKYYLRYFIIAYLVLLITCGSSFAESLGMQNYLASNGGTYTGVREVLIGRQIGVIRDLLQAAGITVVRVFDPLLQEGWKDIYAKVFCLKLAPKSPMRSRTSTLTSSIDDSLLEFSDEEARNTINVNTNNHNHNHNHSRRVSLTAQEFTQSIRKQTVLIQLQHHKKVQTTYSILASIHYYYTKIANEIQGVQSIDFKRPGVDLTKERAKEKHEYPINHKLIKENLPEIFREIKTKEYRILRGTLTAYAPAVFAEIGQLDSVTNKLLASLELNKNDGRIQKSGLGDGRGGEFFFFSTDNNFIIKTINDTELKVLLEILPRYSQYFKKHPNSLISKIYGAFTFEVDSPSDVFHFIVMRNVNGYPSLCIERKYDLKGSSVDRTALGDMEVAPDHLKHYGTLKDGDFNKHEEKLYMPEVKQRQMLAYLTNDVNFLSSEGLIDYSLMVYIVDKAKAVDPDMSAPSSMVLDSDDCELNRSRSLRLESVHAALRKISNHEIGNPLVSIKSTREELYYHIGIIDYLQKFTWKKRVEKHWKQLKAMNFNLDVSSQDAETYSWRFMRYMRQIILQRKLF